MSEKLTPKTFSIKPVSGNDIIDPKIIKKAIHNIHNYIRDNTKIQDESKGVFIAIILISIQKESFRKLIKTYNSSTIVLKPTKIVLDDIIGAYCATELSKYKAIYSRAYGWTMDRIKETTLILPILKDETIDYAFIKNLIG